MTNNQHGQVPEALIDLIDAYAETRHRYGRIYNAKTEAARKAVIEALSGVQALSAAPAEQQAAQVIIDFSQVGTAGPFPVANGRVSLPDATMQDLARMLRPTYEAEQQAAPKAAPVEQDDHQILAITTAYEQGVGKGHQAYNSGKEIANPYSPAYRCDLAWQCGYKEGKEQAQREAEAAPQPSPTPQADSQPEDENDAHNFAICQHFDHWLIEKGALLTPHSEESDGPMAPALNWIASVEAMVAARAPADSVTAPAGGIPGNFITHRASWRKALETSKAHATGDDVTYWDHELRAFDRSFDRLWELMQASPTPPAEQQAQSAGPCVICGSDEPFTGTCGSGDPRALCKQAAPNAAPGVGNSGFDHKTAADLLNNKTVSDEAVRKFVAASRWAHDERAALSATLLAMHGVLTSREEEIALLKKALMEAEAAPQPTPAPVSEREAFEAWIEKDGGDLGTFGTPPNRHYRNSAVNNAWVAWQARAALAAQGGK